MGLFLALLTDSLRDDMKWDDWGVDMQQRDTGWTLWATVNDVKHQQLLLSYLMMTTKYLCYLPCFVFVCQHLMCAGLWCLVEGDASCKTKLDPPLDGTECGADKVGPPAQILTSSFLSGNSF